jgi:nitrogen fixation protein FixH
MQSYVLGAHRFFQRWHHHCVVLAADAAGLEFNKKREDGRLVLALGLVRSVLTVVGVLQREVNARGGTSVRLASAVVAQLQRPRRILKRSNSC